MYFATCEEEAGLRSRHVTSQGRVTDCGVTIRSARRAGSLTAGLRLGQLAGPGHRLRGYD
eukprot:1195032-Prorocentrum_minimum.AAC.3